MPRKFRQDVIRRWKENPVITSGDIPFKCHDMYNAGCIKIDGEYILLITIEKLDGRPAIYIARSEDGLYFRIEREPFIASSKDEDFNEYEEMGVLDARITSLNNEYYIVYLAMGRHGIVLGLGKTKDFNEFERMEIISQPDTKAGALFPRKINGRFAMLERPSSGGSIWIAYSNDLLTWGEREVVLTPRAGFWDQGLIGCAVPPMETESGWLLLYYAVKQTSSGTITKIGAAIL
ncbi:MAG: glycosidase, partial [Deltaproteobacteria bacterium]|nr:glycosidase [Deltaproteobacteria bacterium]